MRLSVFIWLAVVGCAHPPLAGPAEPLGAETAPPGELPTPIAPPTPAVKARRRGDWLDRTEVLAILNAGPAQFLASVDSEAVLREGRFLGWRIRGFRDPVLEESGVHPGDIVLRVNRRSIERPEGFIEVWESLRWAPELSVEVLRENQRLRIRYAIR